MKVDLLLNQFHLATEDWGCGFHLSCYVHVDSVELADLLARKKEQFIL